MHTDLSHLENAEINELMERYYQGESVKKIIKDFDLDVRPANLYKLFPAKEFANYKCEYCGRSLVVDCRSKDFAKIPRRESELYCPTCNHKSYIKKCSCEKCMQSEKKQKEERIKNIHISFGKPQNTIEFQRLSFLEKVYLGTLCRAYLRENITEIAPRNEKNVVLAPTEELFSKMYSKLIENKSIVVSPFKMYPLSRTV